MLRSKHHVSLSWHAGLHASYSITVYSNVCAHMNAFAIRAITASTSPLSYSLRTSSHVINMNRVGLLHTLATLEEHPESVPINALVAIEGTPLADEGKAQQPDIWDMGRMIATAR